MLLFAQTLASTRWSICGRLCRNAKFRRNAEACESIQFVAGLALRDTEAGRSGVQHSRVVESYGHGPRGTSKGFTKNGWRSQERYLSVPIRPILFAWQVVISYGINDCESDLLPIPVSEVGNDWGSADAVEIASENKIVGNASNFLLRAKNFEASEGPWSGGLFEEGATWRQEIGSFPLNKPGASYAEASEIRHKLFTRWVGDDLKNPIALLESLLWIAWFCFSWKILCKRAALSISASTHTDRPWRVCNLLLLSGEVMRLRIGRFSIVPRGGKGWHALDFACCRWQDCAELLLCKKNHLAWQLSSYQTDLNCVLLIFLVKQDSETPRSVHAAAVIAHQSSFTGWVHLTSLIAKMCEWWRLVFSPHDYLLLLSINITTVYHIP